MSAKHEINIYESDQVLEYLESPEGVRLIQWRFLGEVVIYKYMEKEEIIEFHQKIYKVMEKVMQGEEIQAQYIFNAEMVKKYSDKMIQGSNLYFAIPFWVILNEYLNNISVRIVNAPSADKNNLLDEYQEYQEEFKKIKGKSNK